MQKFDFCCPTETIFGKAAELQLGPKLKALGAQKALLIYGGGSVKKNGLLARLEQSLTENGIAFLSQGGVEPNPRVGFVRQLIEQAQKESVDFLVAVGGGSVIDTAKAAALGLGNPGYDIWRDIWLKKAVPQKTMPLAAVVTLAAAGSELSDSAVLTNEKTLQKRGLNTVYNRPRLAFINPELTYSAPRYQVAAGIADIFMHTIERYFAKDDSNYMTDQIAEGLLRTVIRFSADALEKEDDYLSRSEILYCAGLSHNDITGLGRAKDFSVHKLGHELSGRFDVTHGASLTAVWGGWARAVYKTDVQRFAHYAREVMCVDTLDDEKAAILGIERTEEFFQSLGMPTCFSKLGIGIQNETMLDYLADMCTDKDTHTIGTFCPLDRDGVKAVYKSANR